MSQLEDTLAFHLRAAGLTPFEREYVAVKGRRFRWDFAWPEHRLLVEVQGGTFARGKSKHHEGKGIERDCEKLAHAVLHGWRQINVETKSIHDGRALMWIQGALGVS